MNNYSTVIVGGGWAGLALALRLRNNNTEQRLLILEAGQQLGGRARSANMHSPCGASAIVDNGQHLMLGAYTQMLELLAQIGVREQDVMLRTPLRLWMRSLQGGELDLNASAQLPVPLHLLWAFMRAKGLSWLEKLRGIISLERLMQAKLDANSDISVAELLRRYRIPKAIADNLLARLCVAALNTPVEQASARVFVKVLHTAFKSSRAASDLLIPSTDLGAMLAEPATRYLQERNVEIRTASRVHKLHTAAGKISALELQDGSLVQAADYVLACDYHDCAKLLAPIVGELECLAPLYQQLAAFSAEPIITLYYQFGAEVQLPVPMLGIKGGIGEWLFDRRVAGQPGLLAVVVCGTGSSSQYKRAQLAQVVLAELQTLLQPLLGELPAPSDILVLKERRATFSCRVGIDAERPANHTAVANLWLAGDYTATDYPATLEGAIKSGNSCAQAMAARLD